MREIFISFAELLDERLKRGVATTEDSVRYTFFAALLKAGVAPHEVILEFDHPAIAGARVDTWISAYKAEPVALEFKYDRPPPGGRNQPRTQKAGKVFEDFRRQVALARATGARCYFVYVTTAAMAGYFRNPGNGHDGLFNLQPGDRFLITRIYFEGKPQTFVRTLGGPFEAGVISLLSRSLSGGHEIRVYEVGAP